MTADWWLRDRRRDDGRWTVVQWPNAALWVVAVAFLLREVGLAVVGVTAATRNLEFVGRGALLVWALDELVRGVNPLRRTLGAVVLVWQFAAVVATALP